MKYNPNATSLEKGIFFSEMSKKYSRKELEKMTGVAQSYISQLIHLNQLPQEIKRYIQNGKLSVARALLLKKKDIENVKQQCKDGKVSKISNLRRMKKLLALVKAHPNTIHERKETLKFLVNANPNLTPEDMLYFFVRTPS